MLSAAVSDSALSNQMDLTEYVRRVSQQDFGKEFKHTALWNSRLRSTGGRFFPADGHLDFNPHLYAEHGAAIFRQIVRHELCHYHLYFEGKGYKHADKDFKDLLKQVDGLRYAPKSAKASAIHHTYRCQSCDQLYQRKRRVDTKKYRCGKCGGKLIKIQA